jgi:hypothetical protein
MPKTKQACPVGTSISNCHFTNEAFSVNEHMANAVRALAQAAEANAKAIGEAASRLAGPVDQRVALRIGNP